LAADLQPVSVSWLCVFFPSILATVPPLTARHFLHFTQYIPRTKLVPCVFCPTITSRGHTGGGKQDTLGLFFAFYILLFFAPSSSPGAVFSFITRRVQPFQSLVNNIFEFCLTSEACQLLFAFTTKYESERKKHSRRDSNPRPGCQVTRTSHRGGRCSPQLLSDPGFVWHVPAPTQQQ